MELKFLGTGSAFATEHFHSNLVLDVNGKKLLIDAGGTLHLALMAANTPLHALDGVYVTHRHADAWGGAEFLAYASYFDPAFIVDGVRRRLKLFAHPSVRAVLWNGLEHSLVVPNKVAQLEDFFDVQNIYNTFAWQGLTFDLVPTVHCIDNDQPMPCFGLTWKTHEGRSVWFSADATLKPNHPLFVSSDVIFHDCETSNFRTGVHAHYSELLELPTEVRNKITLYQYNDGPRSDARADGFAGWAQQGGSISL